MKENNTKSFSSFFREEYNKLLHYVRKKFDYRVYDDSAEDIIQDVALHLLNRIDVDTHIENLAGYIYSSLKNKVIDTKKQTKNNVLVDSEDKNIEVLIKSLPDELEEDYFDKIGISMERLYEALALLKPDEQAIIMLTEFEGKTFAELSDKWNIPVGTLLSRKHRALAKLAKILTEETNNKIININDYGNKTQLANKKTLAL